MKRNRKRYNFIRKNMSTEIEQPSIPAPFAGLDEEEKAMRAVLLEKYKLLGKSLMDAISLYRDENPSATLGQTYRYLYEKAEEKELLL